MMQGGWENLYACKDAARGSARAAPPGCLSWKALGKVKAVNLATLLYREVLLPFRENRAVLGEN